MARYIFQTLMSALWLSAPTRHATAEKRNARGLNYKGPISIKPNLDMRKTSSQVIEPKFWLSAIFGRKPIEIVPDRHCQMQNQRSQKHMSLEAVSLQ
jgi:hypothetical protein